MLYKVAFWITCLLLVSTGAMAAPRALVRDSSHIGSIKETVLPVAGQFKRSDATSSSLTGARRLDILADPDKFAGDDPAAFPAQAQPHGKNSITVSQFVRHAGFGTDRRNETCPAAKKIPAQIKLVLAQPAAPPVTRKQDLAPRQA